MSLRNSNLSRYVPNRFITVDYTTFHYRKDRRQSVVLLDEEELSKVTKGPKETRLSKVFHVLMGLKHDSIKYVDNGIPVRTYLLK